MLGDLPHVEETPPRCSNTPFSQPVSTLQQPPRSIARQHGPPRRCKLSACWPLWPWPASWRPPQRELPLLVSRAITCHSAIILFLLMGSHKPRIAAALRARRSNRCRKPSRLLQQTERVPIVCPVMPNPPGRGKFYKATWDSNGKPMFLLS